MSQHLRVACTWNLASTIKAFVVTDGTSLISASLEALMSALDYRIST